MRKELYDSIRRFLFQSGRAHFIAGLDAILQSDPSHFDWCDESDLQAIFSNLPFDSSPDSLSALFGVSLCIDED